MGKYADIINNEMQGNLRNAGRIVDSSQRFEEKMERQRALAKNSNSRQAALDEKLSYYQSKEDLLNESKQKQQEMAGITLDKLQKYLPYQIKAQGLSGSGASESTMLQAHANYANTMADIENNYNTQLNELAAYKSNDIQAINDKYDAIEQQASNDAYDELSAGVQEMLDKYVGDDGKISKTDMDKIDKYIDDNGANLTDPDRELLKSLLGKYEARGKIEQDAFDAENAKIENKVDVAVLADSDFLESFGANFKANVGDKIYDVEIGRKILDTKQHDAITKNYPEEPSHGSTVVYDGKVYIYSIKSKSWFLVQGRQLNDSSFKEMCTALGITPYGRSQE